MRARETLASTLAGLCMSRMGRVPPSFAVSLFTSSLHKRFNAHHHSSTVLYNIPLSPLLVMSETTNVAVQIPDNVDPPPPVGDIEGQPSEQVRTTMFALLAQFDRNLCDI